MSKTTRHFFTAFFFLFSLSFFFLSPFFQSVGATEPKVAPLLVAKNKPLNLVTIKKIRHSNNKDTTRVVIDLSRKVAYQVSRDTSSQTLLVKLNQSILGKKLKKQAHLTMKGQIINEIEATQKGRDTVYVSLKYQKLGVHKHMLLKKPPRLVIDLFPPALPLASFTVNTIVIDPGHGGKDPGAKSKWGLFEKDIALDISFRLRKLIENDLKKKVIMTRDRDIFITLKKRTEIANKNHADLFISVHINSSRSRKLKGIEVYLLGRASNKRALRLAARENAAHHKSAIDLQKMILNDLDRDFTRNASLELAHFTSAALKKNLISKYPTKLLGVKQAPFYVLNHTKMPAILAEISFISNRTEEKRLRSKKYRQRAAESLFKGIKAYIHSLESE